MPSAFVGSPDETALAALAGLRARVALLDRAAVVVWINGSWSRYRHGQRTDSVAAVALGVDYIAVCRRSRHPAAAAIAEGVQVVVARAVSFFELEYEAVGGQGRRTKMSVTSAPAGQNGAVVMQVDSYAPTETASAPAVLRAATVGAPMPEVLTGRELEVLTLMARGLENQAIAAELRIGYATVRGHVRSLMAKMGVRSRLEAVVRGVQLDLVRVPRPTSTNGTDRARNGGEGHPR
jgi:DNA-binding NarL/FixJ family response regulator